MSSPGAWITATVSQLFWLPGSVQLPANLCLFTVLFPPGIPFWEKLVGVPTFCLPNQYWLRSPAFQAPVLYGFLSLSAFYRLRQSNFYLPVPGPHPCCWLRQPHLCICPESLSPFLLLGVNPGPLPPSKPNPLEDNTANRGGGEGVPRGRKQKRKTQIVQ